MQAARAVAGHTATQRGGDGNQHPPPPPHGCVRVPLPTSRAAGLAKIWCLRHPRLGGLPVAAGSTYKLHLTHMCFLCFFLVAIVNKRDSEATPMWLYTDSKGRESLLGNDREGLRGEGGDCLLAGREGGASPRIHGGTPLLHHGHRHPIAALRSSITALLSTTVVRADTPC